MSVLHTATVKITLQEAVACLREHRISEPRLDAEVLLAHVLGIDRLQLFVEPDKIVPATELASFRGIISERAAGRPVAYLTGQREFMSLIFRVGPGVLIPRPETELLVEEALRLNPSVVIDVGTGSGAIAVSLAYFLPGVKVYATDISTDALAFARKNAAEHGVAGKVTFFPGSLLEPLVDQAAPALKAQCITANLPYIPAGELDNLPVDVRDYEPWQALDGGPDGLELYRTLIPQAAELFAPGGILLMEIGPGQGQSLIKELAKYKAFTKTEVKCDYAGLERIVRAEFGGGRSGEPV